MWLESCMIIGQLGKEKIDIVRALKHLSSMLHIHMYLELFEVKSLSPVDS